MKHLSTLIAALILFIAQGAQAVPTWAESFGLDGNGPDSQGFYGTGDDYPLAIAAMPDGGVVVVGKLSSPTNSAANDALIRFAADGTILWKNSLSGTAGLCYPANVGCFSDSGGRVARIVSDSDGGIYLASYFGSQAGSGGSSYGYVAKFNSSGAVAWQKNIGKDGDNTALTSLSLTPNGKLVITSSAYPPNNTGHTYPVLSVLDSATGEAQFIRGYDNTSVQYLRAQAGTGSKDGGKFIFCTEVNDLTVVLVNAAGDVLDTKNYFNGYQRTGAIMSIPTADGDFMILSGNVIRKIGADQVTVNGVTSTALVTRFERILNYAGMGGHTIVQTPDGGYLIGGSISVGGADLPPNTNGSKAGIYRLNAQGDVIRVFAYGGFNAETEYDGSTSPGLCSAVPTTDGGFAFTTDTLSYRAQTDERKPDWWIVKTDALGKIRNFKDVAVDVTGRGSSTPFTDSGSQPQLGTYTPIARSWDQSSPQLVLTDPAGSFRIQASSPRILSSRTAEAVVGQHFAYHTLVSYFNPGATITYTATGLPVGFALDSQTGVISGLAKAGTETTTPILISLHVTDGTDTADTILSLTIGDGVPVFTVNGSGEPAYPASSTPVLGLADKVLSFAAQYPGALAGRTLNVQATTTPDVESSWQKLANGSNGYMTPDQSSGRYIINSTNYPTASAVYFRAKLSAPGHPPDLTSNVVGPFNLASNAGRAPQTLFRVIRNGVRADFDFRAIALSAPSGIAVRVQRSTTPSDEAAWSDLQDGTSGQMIQGTTASNFSLVVNTYPPADGIYFRCITSMSGSVDSLSNVIGPYSVIADTPPVVTLSPTPPPAAPGATAPPLIINTDATGTATFTITASATSSRFIKRLSILVDGSVVQEFTGGATSGSLIYTTSVVGVHMIEALAVDDLGCSARAGTHPVRVRVSPPGDAAASGFRASETGSELASTGAGKTYTTTKFGAPWNEPSTWRDEHGNMGVPGSSDLAIVASGAAVYLVTDVEVASVFLDGGRFLGGGFTLKVDQLLTISSGTSEALKLEIGPNAKMFMTNNADFDWTGSTIKNYGTLKMHGRGGMFNLAAFYNYGVSDFQMPLVQPPASGPDPAPDARIIKAPLADTSGLLRGGGILTGTGFLGGLGTGGISLVATGGGNLVATGGGNLVATGGGNLISQDGGTLISQDGGTLISQDGGTLISQDGGTLISQDGGTLDVRGPSGRAEAATAASGLTQTGGEIDLGSTQIVGSLTVNGGVLSGSGLIQGDLTINGGFLTPGHSPGLIAVSGNYTQGSGGTLIVEAAGGEANQFDQVQVGGTATLNGALILHTIAGYVPIPNDSFVPLGFHGVTGAFSSITSNANVALNATGLVAVIDPAKPNPPLGQPTNISTRMKVLTDDNVLIGGFIVTGPVGSTKKVLIHGLGPSLSSAGLTGLLFDPFLEFHYPNGTVVTNDNWGDAPNKDQIPSGFAPKDPKEAIIIADLAPGVYTAIVKGAHGETGIGMTEVYDIDGSTTVALTNVSTRGFVDTDDNVMIGGFIVGGGEPATMLVKVDGPSLKNPPARLTGVLEDPTLELHDANGSVIANDNWRETQESEISSTNMAPKDDKEPAILATLTPGVYTAIVRGKDNTTGIAIVEAYRIK